MSRGLVPLPLLPLLLLLFLLTATTTTMGLKVGLDNISCNGGTTSGSIIDEILCDPDGLVPPEESHNICQLLTRCGAEAGNVRVIMFLAATFTAPDANIVRSSNSYSASAYASAYAYASASASVASSSVASPTENVTTEDGGGVDDRTSINLLKELVVASYKLNGSSSTSTTSKTNNTTSTSSSASSTALSPSSILLVVAIKDPFQVATWHSAALDGTLVRGAVEKAERRTGTSLDQQHFSSAVMHVAQELCQSARPRVSRTLRDIALTVVWIAFVAAFFALLLTIVVALLRAHYRAGRTCRVEAGHEQVRRKESSRPFALTSTSDMQDLGAVYFKSSAKVLLATMDIKAVPPQNCSSTDNLLQG